MPYARIVAVRPAGTTASKSHAWQVLREAARVEPDEAARIAWYRNDPIVPLGRETAEALVASGRYGEVLSFLRQLDADPDHA